VTVTVWVSVFVGSAVDAAVIVTVPPAGTTAGAVYDVAAPLAVCAGEKVPQLPGLGHATDQSTPALFVSLITVAISGAWWPCMIVAFGTVWVIWREIGAAIVTLTLKNTLEAVAFAAIVTVGSELDGTFGGAVKRAGAPLAVCEGVTVPHGRLEQLTSQSTPEFVGSFCTTAIIVAVAFVNIVAGGGWVMVTAGGADTWKVAIALQKGAGPGVVGGRRLEQVWSAVAKAVIVTVEPTS